MFPAYGRANCASMMGLLTLVGVSTWWGEEDSYQGSVLQAKDFDQGHFLWKGEGVDMNKERKRENLEQLNGYLKGGAPDY